MFLYIFFKEVLNALRIIDNKEIYDTLCLCEEFATDIDHMLELFDLISDNNLFLTNCRMNLDENPIWFNSNSF